MWKFQQTRYSAYTAAPARAYRGLHDKDVMTVMIPSTCLAPFVSETPICGTSQMAKP